MKNWLLKTLKENRSFIVFIILMSVFRSAVADWNTVPTGSMKPTIVEGDRILVDKMAYDLRVPFTHISILKKADPERGDIIIFDSEVSGIRLVKRVIGLPGDTIRLENNLLTINDIPLNYSGIVATHSSAIDVSEDLLGVEHFIRLHNRQSKMANIPPIQVPEGHYFVMGDNRDNSADSRAIGFVPRNEIVGKTNRVVMSLNYDNYYIPRSDRFFHTL